MRKIAIFYHCLFALGDPPAILPAAFDIVDDQMYQLQRCGLLDASSEMIVGINGEPGCWMMNHLPGEPERSIPKKARVVCHGLKSRSENLTIVEIEKWLPDHPDWYVLYFHAKGCTNTPGTDAWNLRTRWRNCMMGRLILNWRQCVEDLDAGYESVGCHWMTGRQTPPGQSIWAGNFWWARSEFLATLPSIHGRERIKLSGIASLESRYESEVWIGNGPRLPKVKDYHPAGFLTCP